MKKPPNNQTQSPKNEGRIKNFDELKKYVRIGDQYYKRVLQPDKTGTQYPIFLPRQKGTIIDDFGKAAIEYIKKYEGFVCVPSHTNFQQEINNFFNEYYPLIHQPKEGNCDTILQMLRHVFGEKIDFALDYFQLLYTKPYQRLPILLLESLEKDTGKSSIGILLRCIFRENAIILGNGDLESQFNAIWVKRLAIVIDETSLDKKGIMQMIKRMSTETGKVTANEKNKAQIQTDFFGKFIFMSNEEGKALPIERGDTRFAVFKVPTFKEAGIDKIPNIEPCIEKEIPAFLHLITHRELIHLEESRMYFAPEVYQTKQLDLYQHNSVSQTARAIRVLVYDSFIMFPKQTQLCLSVTNLIQELKEDLRGIDREKVQKAVEQELNVKLGKKQRYMYYSLMMEETNPSGHAKPIEQNNRVFVFNRKDFLAKAKKREKSKS